MRPQIRMRAEMSAMRRTTRTAPHEKRISGRRTPAAELTPGRLHLVAAPNFGRFRHVKVRGPLGKLLDVRFVRHLSGSGLGAPCLSTDAEPVKDQRGLFAIRSPEKLTPMTLVILRLVCASRPPAMQFTVKPQDHPSSLPLVFYRLPNPPPFNQLSTVCPPLTQHLLSPPRSPLEPQLCPPDFPFSLPAEYT